MFDEQLNISRIEVKLDSTTSGQLKTLYANGRMQVRVLVLLHGIDNNGDGASLAGHPALQSLRLINYNGARPLEGNWNVSVQENRYAHEMSGGAPRLTEIPRVTDNRISDDSDPVQIFQFWVSAFMPGVVKIAAEIIMNAEVLRSNGVGFDSSVTLEAIPPRKYPLGNFSLSKYGDEVPRAHYDTLQKYHLSLHAEGRLINLLDWYSTEVRLDPYDSESAVQIYASGNIPAARKGRSFYGYMAPIYGLKASIRSPLGYLSIPINSEPGQLTLVLYVSADLQVTRESESAFEFAVIDHFGTEHRLCIDGDKEQRTLILGESRRPMKQLA